MPDGPGVAPASAAGTDVFFGGAVGSSAYAVAGNAGPTMSTIVLQDAAAVTDTLNMTLTGSSKITMVSGGSFSPGIQQNGASNWNINNGGGASAPIRFSNSFTIGGSGSGNVNIATPFAASSAVNFTINESGGATIALMVSNSNVTGTQKLVSLQNGLVDFQNSSALGATSFAITLNGGGLESTTGTTLSTYTGNDGGALAAGITLGGNMTFAGPVNWSLGASAVALTGNRTIIANTGGTNGTTIGGAISGAGFGITLDPTSTGTLTLTNGNDTYSGPTNINGGTLFDNGNITASAVSVAAGATLAGKGTIGLSSTAVSIIGTVAPGSTTSSVGALNLLGGAVFSGSSAIYNVDLNAAGSSDDLAVTGNLDLGTGTTLNINVLDATSGNTYTIATYTGTLTGTFAAVNNVPAGYTLDYGTGSNSAITLDVAAVPEPASMGLIGLCTLAMLRRRRHIA